MRRLLQRVIAGRPIDLVHAHATGTKINDPIELAAIEAALPTTQLEDQPSLYSHKGSLGHSLGAAGLVAVVLNCMMHEAGRVLPNVRTTDPLPTGRVRLSRDSVTRPIRRSIAAGSGFGGPTAVVSLRSL
jgi:3-oxoacyl-(acyl-carrier-protein) synthase